MSELLAAIFLFAGLLCLALISGMRQEKEATEREMKRISKLSNPPPPPPPPPRPAPAPATQKDDPLHVSYQALEAENARVVGALEKYKEAYRRKDEYASKEIARLHEEIKQLQSEKTGLNSEKIELESLVASYIETLQEAGDELLATEALLSETKNSLEASVNENAALVVTLHTLAKAANPNQMVQEDHVESDDSGPFDTWRYDDHWVIVVTISEFSRHAPVRVRPLPGQGYPEHMRVACSIENREHGPGMFFAIYAKLVNGPNKPHLFVYHKHHEKIVPLSREEAMYLTKYAIKTAPLITFDSLQAMLSFRP